MPEPSAGTQVSHCTHWVGSEQRHCMVRDDVRLYLAGPRCPAHTPNALRGLDEPEPGPGLPATAWTTPSPLNESRVADQRAVASGKRRSSPTTYRAARQAQEGPPCPTS